MNGKQLVKLLKEKGWTVDRIHGSHYMMKKGGEIETIPVHGTKDIPTGLLNKILKRAGLK